VAEPELGIDPGRLDRLEREAALTAQGNYEEWGHDHARTAPCPQTCVGHDWTGETQPSFDTLAALDDAVAGIGGALGAALGPLVGKLEQARGMAADLEAQTAEAERHLGVMVALVESMGGATWAQDTANVEAARAFLVRTVTDE